MVTHQASPQTPGGRIRALGFARTSARGGSRRPIPPMCHFQCTPVSRPPPRNHQPRPDNGRTAPPLTSPIGDGSGGAPRGAGERTERSVRRLIGIRAPLPLPRGFSNPCDWDHSKRFDGVIRLSLTGGGSNEQHGFVNRSANPDLWSGAGADLGDSPCFGAGARFPGLPATVSETPDAYIRGSQRPFLA